MYCLQFRLMGYVAGYPGEDTYPDGEMLTLLQSIERKMFFSIHLDLIGELNQLLKSQTILLIQSLCYQFIECFLEWITVLFYNIFCPK